jgi:hypothetical protein
MQNVNGSADFVNDILGWAEEMEKKGLYDHSTSKNLRTALKALVTVLDPDEQRDADHLIAEMESIAERWARANRANPATMRAYKQRAIALLEDYVGYMKDPASFKGRGGTSAPKRPERKEERRAAPPPASGAADPAVASFNTFRLPNGKVFRYSLPDNFTIEDLRRVVYHLLPATADFDPMRPGGFPPVSPALDSSATVQ